MSIESMSLETMLSAMCCAVSRDKAAKELRLKAAQAVEKDDRIRADREQQIAELEYDLKRREKKFAKTGK